LIEHFELLKKLYTEPTVSATDSPSVRALNRKLNMSNNTDLNSMTFDALVPTNSKYLKQTDVGEDGVVLTIRGFKQEVIESDDGEEMKVILYFVEPDYKPMVLNKTNSQLLGKATGVNTAGEARGKQIVVYSDPSVGFGGKMTGGLRIKRYSTAAPASPAAGKSFDQVMDDVGF